MKTGLYLGEVPIGKVVVAVAGENGIQLQEKTVTPSKGKPIEVTPDTGIDGLSKVIVEPIPAVYIDTTTTNAPGPGDMSNKTIAFANGKEITGELESKDKLELKSGEPSFDGENKNLIVKCDNPSRAIIQADADVFITVEGAKLGNVTKADVLSGKTFTSENGLVIEGTMPNNGSIMKTLDRGTVLYPIPAGYTDGGTVSISTQTKEATPNTENQTIESDTGKVLSAVYVKPIPSDYVIPTSTQAAKTWTPSTSEQSIPAGTYCSGKQTINAMPAGTLSSPNISVNSSGVITATSGVSTAGYLATSASKSNTKNLTTQRAKTITPSTSPQTAVASGVYTTGAITVEAIPSSYVKPTKKYSGGTTTLQPGGIVTAEAGSYFSGAWTISAATGGGSGYVGALVSTTRTNSKTLSFNVNTDNLIGFHVIAKSLVYMGEGDGEQCLAYSYFNGNTYTTDYSWESDENASVTYTAVNNNNITHTIDTGKITLSCARTGMFGFDITYYLFPIYSS